MRPTPKPSFAGSATRHPEPGHQDIPPSGDSVAHRALSGGELDLSLQFTHEQIESWGEQIWSELDAQAGGISSVRLPDGMTCIPPGLGALPNLKYLRLPHPGSTCFSLTGTGSRSREAPTRDITLELIYDGTRCLLVDLFEDDTLTYTGRSQCQLQATYFRRDGSFSDRYMEFVERSECAHSRFEAQVAMPPEQVGTSADAPERMSQPTLSLQTKPIYIEMGQGVIVHGPASFVTSELTSCSLICGINEHSGHCGAFHYPGMALRSDPAAVADMRAWFEALAPSRVHIALTTPAKHAMEAAFMQGVPEDQRQLAAWVEDTAHLKPETTYSTYPRMDCRDGALAVTHAPPFSGDASNDLQHLPAGGYEDKNGQAFDLFGKDRN